MWTLVVLAQQPAASTGPASGQHQAQVAGPVLKRPGLTDWPGVASLVLRALVDCPEERIVRVLLSRTRRRGQTIEGPRGQLHPYITQIE